MENKKTYEEPSVTKVEFEFNETVAASGCSNPADYMYDIVATCLS